MAPPYVPGGAIYPVAGSTPGCGFVLCKNTPVPPPPRLIDRGDLGKSVFRGREWSVPSLEDIDELCNARLALVDGREADEDSSRIGSAVPTAGEAVVGKEGLGLGSSGSVGLRILWTPKLLEAEGIGRSSADCIGG